MGELRLLRVNPAEAWPRSELGDSRAACATHGHGLTRQPFANEDGPVLGPESVASLCGVRSVKFGDPALKTDGKPPVQSVRMRRNAGMLELASLWRDGDCEVLGFVLGLEASEVHKLVVGRFGCK